MKISMLLLAGLALAACAPSGGGGGGGEMELADYLPATAPACDPPPVECEPLGLHHAFFCAGSEGQPGQTILDGEDLPDDCVLHTEYCVDDDRKYVDGQSIFYFPSGAVESWSGPRDDLYFVYVCADGASLVEQVSVAYNAERSWVVRYYDAQGTPDPDNPACDNFATSCG